METKPLWCETVYSCLEKSSTLAILPSMRFFATWPIYVHYSVIGMISLSQWATEIIKFIYPLYKNKNNKQNHL